MTYCGFSKRLIPVLVCQKDHTSLVVQSESDSNNAVIWEGVLVCPNCQSLYGIRNGIADIIAHQEKLSETLSSEAKVRDEKAAHYDGHFTARYEREVPSTIDALGDITSAKMIEYGAGTGRLTVEILSAQVVLSSDFSLQSLMILSQKLAGRENVGLVLANAATLVTAAGFFDRALAAQIYEHVPTPAERETFLKNISDTLKPSGIFVASIYHQDFRRILHGEKKQGYHAGQIFYYYFSKSEIREEISKVFEIADLRCIDIVLPLQARLHQSLKTEGVWSRFLEHAPLLNLFGHLVLVTATKKKEFVSKKSMTYEYGFILPNLLKKRWYWFTEPHEVSEVAMVNFFSYHKVDAPGFKCKKGLTTIIDLDQSLDEVWSHMRESFIRAQITRGQNNGIVVRHDDNFDQFEKIYNDFRDKKGLVRERFESFRNGTLFSAYYEDEMLAGIVYLTNGIHMRAWQIASSRLSDDRNRNGLIGRANRMVVWEAIKYAKVAGYKVFDLGGIDPFSKDSGTVHVAEFKEAFGGVRTESYFYSKIYSTVLKWYNQLRN